MNTTPEFQTINLPPSALLVTKNTRYSLLKVKVAALADSIKEVGYIHTNLKVEELAEPGPNGETHWLREGHYRKAAAELLAKDGMEVLLPCTVVEPLEGVKRTKQQISENWDRTDMSPMDMGIAIQELLTPEDGSEGMKKVEIRKLFSRAGGRKGLAMQPLSNAMLNIYLSFLEFPKNIQNLIHEGKLRVHDAYKLSRRPKEEWAGIVAKAEAAREAEIADEEKMEEQFLAEEKKAEETRLKAIADAEALANAQKIAEEKKKEADAKLDAAAQAYKDAQAIPAKDKDKKKAADEAFKAKEADAKAAEKLRDAATKEAEKLQAAVDRNKKLAAERAQKLADARAAAAKKQDNVKVDTEAAANGGKVKLTGPQMMKVIEDLSLGGSFPKVSLIGQAIKRCFNSDITDTQLLSELGYITGERKDRPKHMPKAATTK
jgi:hypothetical protein